MQECAETKHFVKRVNEATDDDISFLDSMSAGVSDRSLDDRHTNGQVQHSVQD